MSAPELRRRLPGTGQVLFTARGDGDISNRNATRSGPDADARAQLERRIGVSGTVRGRQVHGAVVARVQVRGARGDRRRLDDETAEADGQATSTRGVGVMVLTADCLPVALGSVGAVAMVHAGWRGLAAGVLEEGALAIAELGGEEQITAVIGPGAGACCYEVGPEVHEALTGVPHDGVIDLRAIARSRLIAAGVARVEDVEACTICDRRFFSHRREGSTAGRQAGVAWLS